jgi:hypothetical protein
MGINPGIDLEIINNDAAGSEVWKPANNPAVQGTHLPLAAALTNTSQRLLRKLTNTTFFSFIAQWLC